MISAEAIANQTRCEQILECKHQINYWRAKLSVLEQQQEEHIKLARLRLDAQGTWKALSREDRAEKKFILAALESESIPTALDDCPDSVFPPSIRLDRDILLARVARDDFAEKYIKHRLFVPPKLRDDKEVILAIVKKHPQVIECMSTDLRDDEEILDAVLSCTELPSHFLQHFSSRIRQNPELMLRVISHPDGMDSLGCFAPELRNHKTFFLQIIDFCRPDVCETQFLRHASHQLRADYDVVFVSVAKYGLNLKHASYPLRRDKRVVTTACQQNSAAFKHCLPGPVKTELLQDYDFVRNVVIKHASPSVLRECMERFGDDRPLLVQVAANDWSSVPDLFQTNVDFVQQALHHNPDIYMELSDSFQERFDVASIAFQSTKVTADVLLEISMKCPTVLGDSACMLAMVQNPNSMEIVEETLFYSPMDIRSDKEIMMLAVKNNPLSLSACSEELQQDKEIVLAAGPRALCEIHDTYQMLNPDVVIAAIENSAAEDLLEVFDDICEDLWCNRDVAKAWLGKGGEWLDYDFPEEFSQDEELLLLLAKFNTEDFANVATDLVNNKDFMMKALAVDGRLIEYVEDDDLRRDYDLVLVAFANNAGAIHHFSGAQDFEFLVELAQAIRLELQEHDSFMDIIMAQINGTPRTDCPLTMLNQGPEMIKFQQETLSSLLDLAKGKELEDLRIASDNLLAWGL